MRLETQNTQHCHGTMMQGIHGATREHKPKTLAQTAKTSHCNGTLNWSFCDGDPLLRLCQDDAKEIPFNESKGSTL